MVLVAKGRSLGLSSRVRARKEFALKGHHLDSSPQFEFAKCGLTGEEYLPL